MSDYLHGDDTEILFDADDIIAWAEDSDDVYDWMLRHVPGVEAILSGMAGSLEVLDTVSRDPFLHLKVEGTDRITPSVELIDAMSRVGMRLDGSLWPCVTLSMLIRLLNQVQEAANAAGETKRPATLVLTVGQLRKWASECDEVEEWLNDHLGDDDLELVFGKATPPKIMIVLTANDYDGYSHVMFSTRPCPVRGGVGTTRLSYWNEMDGLRVLAREHGIPDEEHDDWYGQWVLRKDLGEAAAYLNS